MNKTTVIHQAFPISRGIGIVFLRTRISHGRLFKRIETYSKVYDYSLSPKMEIKMKLFNR